MRMRCTHLAVLKIRTRCGISKRVSCFWIQFSSYQCPFARSLFFYPFSNGKDTYWKLLPLYEDRRTYLMFAKLVLFRFFYIAVCFYLDFFYVTGIWIFHLATWFSIFHFYGIYSLVIYSAGNVPIFFHPSYFRSSFVVISLNRKMVEWFIQLC